MKVLKTTLCFVLVLGIWQVTVLSGKVIPYLLPSIGEVIDVFIQLISKRSLQTHMLVSLKRVFSGYGLAVLVAIPLATFFYTVKSVGTFFEGLLNFIRNIPPLATVPLLILWFGIGEGSKLALIILASFFVPRQTTGVQGLI